jgi:membrane protease YdiL (CAAX protease family)
MKLLTKFFLFTYAISWACFITVAILSYRSQSTVRELDAFQQLLVFLGAITPSLVALALTTRAGLPGGTQTLLKRIGKWEVNAKWYVFAAGYMAIIKLLVALIYRAVTGAWPAFGQESWLLMAGAVFISTWVQAGEEIGWRGFALPRLSLRFGLPLSTLLLGVIWACWHLPLFFVKGANTFGQSFPLYLLQVMSISVAIGWLYWRTGGSLLLTMLMHAAINNTKDIVPSAVPGATNPFALSNSLVGWLTVTLLWICAAYFLTRMRNAKLLLS